jgi:hypothetical protein
LKTYIVNVPNPDHTCHPHFGGHVVKMFSAQEEAHAECKRLNVEERREMKNARYQVTEVEAHPDAVQSYAAARAEVEAAENRAFEASLAAFSAGSRALFEANPKLVSFAWRQYRSTSCTGAFSSENVDCYTPDINGVGGWDVDGRSGWHWKTGEWTGDGEPSEMAKSQRAVALFLESFHEDHLMDLFGIDALVTVHRDGRVETEEYCDDSYDCAGLYYGGGYQDDEDEDEEDDGEDEVETEE